MSEIQKSESQDKKSNLNFEVTKSAIILNFEFVFKNVFEIVSCDISEIVICSSPVVFLVVPKQFRVLCYEIF